MCRFFPLLFISLTALELFSATIGSIPSSRYQYAEDCEYESLLALPWVNRNTRKVKVEFKCPKSMEETEVAPMYKDTSLYNGAIKLVGGNVVLMFQLFAIPNADSDEFRLIQQAKDKDFQSTAFFGKFKSVISRKGVVEIGLTKVSGLNCMWVTSKMERRLQDQIIYRGVNRIYMIPLKDGKRVVGASVGVAVADIDEIPYSDFKAFLSVGEKIIKSIKIAEDSKDNTILPSSEILKLNTCDLAKFNTRKLPGSCGLDVDVYYPKCMEFEEGGFQTHTIGKVSYESNGDESLVMITASVFNPGKELARAFRDMIAEGIDEEDLADFIPNGAKFLGGGIVSIRERKVIWCEFEIVVERMGVTTGEMIRYYMIPADSGYLFNLSFSVTSATGKIPRNDFNALRPMIQSCAVSLTLKDYAQFNSKSPSLSKASPNVTRTKLPGVVIEQLNKGGIKEVNLSRIRSLKSPTLNVSVPFPAQMKIVSENTTDGLTIKAVEAWKEHGILLSASVMVEDVGEEGLRDLREGMISMSGWSKKRLARQCESELGCNFIDGGIVRDGARVFSWFDVATETDGRSNCRRMIIFPARDGKCLTIFYAVTTTGNEPPIEDFRALMPLFDKCKDGIGFVLSSK